MNTVNRFFWRTIWHNSRRIKFTLDFGVWMLAIPAAFFLRLEDAWLDYRESMALFGLVAAPLVAFAIREFKFHKQSWAHLDGRDVSRLAVGVSLATLALAAEAWLLQQILPIPRSVALIAGALAFLGLIGIRGATRVASDALRGTHPRNEAGGRVLILGAGEAGTILAREMIRHPRWAPTPIGFLDDDPKQQGTEHHGVPVLGKVADLERVARDTNADEVLFTIPSASPAVRREAFARAEAAGVRMRSVPAIFDILTGDSPTQIQNVLDTFVNRGRPQNILLIGGAGYIGSGLIPMLLDRGYYVRVLDSLIYGTGALGDVVDHPRFEMVDGDFRQVNRVVEAMQGIDTVVHLGAIVGDPACALDEELTVEVNLLATKMIAEVAKGYGVQRFLFASTCSVYGASDEILDEESALNPVSLYARTKIASEQVLLSMQDERFAPVILRFGTVYGFSGRTRFDLVVNLLTAKAIQDKHITLFGGDQWRPFIHVQDVAKALLVSLEAPISKTGGRTFNVGSDEQNYTLADVAHKIRDQVPDARISDEGHDADRRNYRVSFGRIREELGFTPDWSLEDGIRQVAGALRSGRVADYTDPNHSNVRFMTEEGLSKIVRREFGTVYDLIAEQAQGDDAKPAIQPGR